MGTHAKEHPGQLATTDEVTARAGRTCPQGLRGSWPPYPAPDTWIKTSGLHIWETDSSSFFQPQVWEDVLRQPREAVQSPVPSAPPWSTQQSRVSCSTATPGSSGGSGYCPKR